VAVHLVGLFYARRRRLDLLAHLHHLSQAETSSAAIVSDAEACKALLSNIFPPQVLPHLLAQEQRLLQYDGGGGEGGGEGGGGGGPERSIARQHTGCSFLFAKVVGLAELVGDASQRPRTILLLLQSIFDRFDRLTETFNVQKVRKTVNESYMVAAGLPDPELLGSPQQRALGTCALAVAMVHVMDVVNAARPPGSAPLSVQIGVHSGSAIAGIIGHRKYQLRTPPRPRARGAAVQSG